MPIFNREAFERTLFEDLRRSPCDLAPSRSDDLMDAYRYSFIRSAFDNPRATTSTAPSTLERPTLNMETLQRAMALINEVPYNIPTFRIDPGWYETEFPTFRPEPEETPLPKEEPMNELLEGLEAMITRVVKRELALQQVLTSTNPTAFMGAYMTSMREYPSDYKMIARELAPPAAAPVAPTMSTDAFGAQFASFITAAPRAFDEVVKRAVLDQPWFDGAIKAEVAEATITSAGLDEDQVVQLINQRTVSEDRARDIADLAASECVSRDSLDDIIVENVRNMNHDYFAFNDQVQSVVRDMDFSVSVDR